ncbi:MAG: hypothetical protein R3C05_02330 [Pirellulaceae bacterium]
MNIDLCRLVRQVKQFDLVAMSKPHWLSVSETVCDPFGITPLVENRHNQDNV